jgi:hypothetical protein
MPKAIKPVDSLSDGEFAQIVRRAIALPDAPPMLVRAAIDLWTDSRPHAPKSVDRAALCLVIAELSFDSWARPAVAFGMRAAVSDTRHLRFRAMGRDIDLRISPAAAHFTLTGQVLGPDEPGVVKLVEHSDDGLKPSVSLVTSLDALGEFRLDGVRRGTYRLTLRMGCNEIRLPPVEVGARPR